MNISPKNNRHLLDVILIKTNNVSEKTQLVKITDPPLGKGKFEAES